VSPSEAWPPLGNCTLQVWGFSALVQFSPRRSGGTQPGAAAGAQPSSVPPGSEIGGLEPRGVVVAGVARLHEWDLALGAAGKHHRFRHLAAMAAQIPIFQAGFHPFQLQRAGVHPGAGVCLRLAVPAVVRAGSDHHHQQQHGGQRGDDHQGEVAVLALGDGGVLLVAHRQGLRLGTVLLLGGLLPQGPDADTVGAVGLQRPHRVLRERSRQTQHHRPLVRPGEVSVAQADALQLRSGLDVVLQVHFEGSAADLRDADPPAGWRGWRGRGCRRPPLLRLAVCPSEARRAQALQVVLGTQEAGAAVQTRARGTDGWWGTAGSREAAEGHRRGAALGGPGPQAGSGGAGLRRRAAAGGDRHGRRQRGGAWGGRGGGGGGGGAAEVSVLQVVEELAGVFGGEVAARLLGPPQDHAAGVHPLHQPAHLADAVEGVAGSRHGPQPGEEAGEIPRDGVDVEVADVQLLEVVEVVEVLGLQLGDAGVASQAELGEAAQPPQHRRHALQQVVGDVQLVEVVLGLEELLV